MLFPYVSQLKLELNVEKAFSRQRMKYETKVSVVPKEYETELTDKKKKLDTKIVDMKKTLVRQLTK